MTEFTFKAPTLFEPATLPDDSLYGELHDARGMAEHLAKIKKFALWLKTEMDGKGLATGGPFVDESGWILEVPCNEGFVTCIVSGPDGDNTHFHMLVAEHSGATREACDTIETILRNSNEISELKTEQ